jgi:hypothetical protein
LKHNADAMMDMLVTIYLIYVLCNRKISEVFVKYVFKAEIIH